MNDETRSEQSQSIRAERRAVRSPMTCDGQVTMRRGAIPMTGPAPQSRPSATSVDGNTPKRPLGSGPIPAQYLPLRTGARGPRTAMRNLFTRKPAGRI
jgi:hypothetical protein